MSNVSKLQKHFPVLACRWHTHKHAPLQIDCACWTVDAFRCFASTSSPVGVRCVHMSPFVSESFKGVFKLFSHYQCYIIAAEHCCAQLLSNPNSRKILTERSWAQDGPTASPDCFSGLQASDFKPVMDFSDKVKWDIWSMNVIEKCAATA